MAGQNTSQSTQPSAPQPAASEGAADARVPLEQLVEQAFATFGVEPHVLVGAAAQQPDRKNFTENEMKKLVSNFASRKV